MYESSGGEENGAESLLVESMNESDAPDQQPSLLIKTKPTSDENQLRQDPPPMLIAEANHSLSQPLRAKNPNEALAKASQPLASNMPQHTRIFKHAKNPNKVLAQMSMGDIAHAHGYVNAKHLS